MRNFTSKPYTVLFISFSLAYDCSSLNATVRWPNTLMFYRVYRRQIFSRPH